MKKKKILKGVLFVILILILIFLAFTIRKMFIIKELSQKAANYKNSNNYYQKITTNSGIITECYRKGDKSALFLKSITDENETIKMESYFNGTETHTFLKTEDNTITKLDNPITMHISLFSIDARVFTEDLWGFFAQSAMLSIRSEICNGKDCYVIKYAPVNELYVEKETGLVIKAIEGTVIKEDGTTYSNIAEYYHEFNNVDDSVFIEPNIE